MTASGQHSAMNVRQETVEFLFERAEVELTDAERRREGTRNLARAIMSVAVVLLTAAAATVLDRASLNAVLAS